MPTSMTLTVTVDADRDTTAGVFADLTHVATEYAGVHQFVNVSAHEVDAADDGPSDADLGRIAYDTHVSTLLAAELTIPESLADFDDLHPDHRNAWIQAALAARNA